MSIYTKRGDKGKTSLIAGECKKDEPIIEAYGSIDELNSLIGLAVSFDVEKDVMRDIQHKLYLLSSELAGGKKELSWKDVEKLETLINECDKNLSALNRFVVPGGCKKAAFLHIIRSVCRRAERRVVAVRPREELIAYLNRLSDLFFVLARKENKKVGLKEITL